MNRRMLRYVDWALVAATLGLLVGGGVILFSATRTFPDPWVFVKARVLHAALGLGVLVVFTAVDYQALGRLWRPLWVVTVALLATVDVIGRTAQGAQRWIPLGPLSFQPSELAKLLLVITLAKHLDGHRELTTLRQLVPVLVHAAIPILLIIQQPDMGTSMVVAAILAAMLFAAGTPLRWMGGLTAAGLAAAPFLWGALHDYQRRRLLVFLDPSLDPLGAGYALIQSKIAVGSGQLFGKGFLQGTQNLLHFIPEQHTDFIFTVIGEELGFAGALVMLALFAVWLWRAGAAAMQAKDRLGTLMAVGILTMIAFHLFINVGMTVGLAPVTGIPLPFISHGGSALLAMLAGTGLLLNIGMRRKKILF
ncbi:MAG TPA: rod shape-determining protein RodA [bacterium]|nr:rod shape-determining protein RodA [bacterium]